MDFPPRSFTLGCINLTWAGAHSLTETTTGDDFADIFGFEIVLGERVLRLGVCYIIGVVFKWFGRSIFDTFSILQSHGLPNKKGENLPIYVTQHSLT